jgi:putative NADPH-quinone reductase
MNANSMPRRIALIQGHPDPDPSRFCRAIADAYVPGFAVPPFDAPRAERKRQMKLAAKSAHIVMTMGMPALFYRLYFRAHSLKSLESNTLRFVGMGPVRESLFGRVESPNEQRRIRWLERMREAGRQGN